MNTILDKSADQSRFVIKKYELKSPKSSSNLSSLHTSSRPTKKSPRAAVSCVALLEEKRVARGELEEKRAVRGVACWSLKFFASTAEAGRSRDGDRRSQARSREEDRRSAEVLKKDRLYRAHGTAGCTVYFTY
ncbi:unnamed protein product [Cuscuta epithymum]|uniref:Uncharacterized protein n=1 Tax=Cuscuta epithymum TaxID=186058 RepID=A0AAV0DFS1_9ASTE|nr:unnamed protein product [Cuscuta epithymum]